MTEFLTAKYAEYTPVNGKYVNLKNRPLYVNLKNRPLYVNLKNRPLYVNLKNRPLYDPFTRDDREKVEKGWKSPE